MLWSAEIGDLGPWKPEGQEANLGVAALVDKGDNMRILVTTASRYGSTKEIGAAVAEVLADSGHEVDLLDPDEVDRLDVYRAAVLGSAVYAGRLSVSLRDLVERRVGQLAGMPVWLFWSGPVGRGAASVAGGSKTSAAIGPEDVDVIARRVGARDVHCFAGSVMRAKLGLAERAQVALIEAEDGDYRDFDAVTQWAERICRELPTT